MGPDRGGSYLATGTQLRDGAKSNRARMRVCSTGQEIRFPWRDKYTINIELRKMHLTHKNSVTKNDIEAGGRLGVQFPASEQKALRGGCRSTG